MVQQSPFHPWNFNNTTTTTTAPSLRSGELSPITSTHSQRTSPTFHAPLQPLVISPCKPPQSPPATVSDPVVTMPSVVCTTAREQHRRLLQHQYRIQHDQFRLQQQQQHFFTQQQRLSSPFLAISSASTVDFAVSDSSNPFCSTLYNGSVGGTYVTTAADVVTTSVSAAFKDNMKTNLPRALADNTHESPNEVTTNDAISIPEQQQQQPPRSPLPTMPEEVLIKMDPSLCDPPPPPPADITIAKPYQCDQCLKRYSGIKSLKNHKLTHSDIRPHKCSICGKAFLRADKMRLHEISHLNVKPFECATCKQRFTRSDKLKIHHRTHTGVRPYACSFCPKRFTRSDKLKIHERIHTKIKPYECAHCGKCFARSDKRRLHERIHLYGPRPRASCSNRKPSKRSLASGATTSACVVLPTFLSPTDVCSFPLNVDSLTSAPSISCGASSSTLSTSTVLSTAFGLASIAGAANAAATFVNPLGLQPHQLAACGYFDPSKKVQTSNFVTSTINHSNQAFTFPLPTCQPIQFSPQQHQSTLASLAGIAQYHPAFFAAQQQQRQLTPPSTLSVPIYQQQQQQQPCVSNQQQIYPQATPVMPFFVGTTNVGSLTPFIPQTPILQTTSSYEPPSATSSTGSTSSPPTPNNLTAVMAAAVFGRQFQSTGASHPSSQSAFASQSRPQLFQSTLKADPPVKPEAPTGFRFYNPQANQQMLQQHQQQVMQLHHQLQQQQLMQQHTAMLQQQQQQQQQQNNGLIGLLPQAAAAAAQFIPSMVSQQYQQQQYAPVQTQRQQQQQYMATALTLNSSVAESQQPTVVVPSKVRCSL